MTNSNGMNVERETRPPTDRVQIGSITKGMDVIGASGDLIGTVDAVYQGTGVGAPASAPATTATAPPGTPSRAGYLEVTTQGVFGGGAINTQKLWIPLDLVRHIDQDAGRLSVNATKRDVQDQYTKEPDTLSRG